MKWEFKWLVKKYGTSPLATAHFLDSYAMHFMRECQSCGPSKGQEFGENRCYLDHFTWQWWAWGHWPSGRKTDLTSLASCTCDIFCPSLLHSFPFQFILNLFLFTNMREKLPLLLGPGRTQAWRYLGESWNFKIGWKIILGQCFWW